MTDGRASGFTRRRRSAISRGHEERAPRLREGDTRSAGTPIVPVRSARRPPGSGNLASSARAAKGSKTASWCAHTRCSKYGESTTTISRAAHLARSPEEHRARPPNGVHASGRPMPSLRPLRRGLPRKGNHLGAFVIAAGSRARKNRKSGPRYRSTLASQALFRSTGREVRRISAPFRPARSLWEKARWGYGAGTGDPTNHLNTTNHADAVDVGSPVVSLALDSGTPNSSEPVPRGNDPAPLLGEPTMGKIIGIDLGTTNSVVAVMEGKEAQGHRQRGGLAPHAVASSRGTTRARSSSARSPSARR